MTAPILDWQAASEAAPARAGGKGWQLGTLAELGVPVPPGFVIDAAVVGGRHRGDALPAALVAALSQELEGRGWNGQPLAVRSSAVAEDSAQASFAGIFRSFLNVRGLPALTDAVREVWDSVDSPAAEAYRQRLGIAARQTGMAVVIMPLLPAVAAGIAFTCDPVSGRRDQLLIHAHWGLGEALVSGQADGDEYRLQLTDWDDMQPLVLVGQRRGSKSRMTVIDQHGGTTSCDTPADLAARAVLDAQQVTALAGLVLEAASVLDYAASGYDVEWVWDGERFWIVQARPVTRSARHTYPALRSQPTYWSRMNSREVAPEPLSALEWSAMRSVLHRMMVCTLQLAGYRALDGAERVALRHGRFYIDTSVWQWEAFDAFDLLPAAATDMFGGQQPAIAVSRPTVRQRAARTWRNLRYLIRCVQPRRRGKSTLRRARDQAARWFAAGQPVAQADLIRQLRAHAQALRQADDLFFLQVSSGSVHFILFDLARKYCHGEGHGIAAALLAGGEPSVTAAQSYALMQLAQLAAADAAALAWLRSADRIGSDWSSQLPQDSVFRRAFAQFLERYGHRGVYESYLRSPRWRETPDYLFDNVLGLIGCDPAQLRSRQLQASADARRRLQRALPPWLRPLTGVLVRWATLERNLREGARSALTAYLEIVRRDLLALGRCWTGSTALQSPEDIFHLTLAEVFALAEGRLSATAAAGRATRRRRQLQSWAAVDAPDVIVEHADGSGPNTAADDPTASSRADRKDERSDGVWHGMVVGGGRASGTACVARHPTEALGLRTGDVLVAPSTDPSWTPLFLKAGALVTETGGYLSHGAIVAREFGIPAVVNVPGILAQISGGDMLEVDGNRGTVRVLRPSG